MRKIIIKNELGLQKTIQFYGEKWGDEIRTVVKEFPCILVSCYCDDIEFGEYYQFTSIKSLDMINLNDHKDLCLN